MPDTIEQRVGRLENDVQSVAESVNKLLAEMSTRNTTLASQEQILKNMEKQMDILVANNTKLVDQSAAFQANMIQCPNRHDAIEKENNRTRDKIAELFTSINKERAQTTKQIDDEKDRTDRKVNSIFGLIFTLMMAGFGGTITLIMWLKP